MKNLIAVLMLAVIVLASACGGVDKELIGKIQADLTKIQGMASSFETLGTGIANLNNQLNAVPEAMKTESNAEYQNMLRITNTMTQKYQATLAEQNDLTAKLNTLVGDYTAGKIKTEDVMKEYETLSVAVQGMAEVTERMSQKVESIQTELAKMSATWNAKAEEAAQ